MSQTVLIDRALVRVSGPDWRSFLQGLLTQDVESLAPRELRYGALLTPQGRLRLDLFLFGAGDEALLDVAASRRSELVQALTLYRLRAKVELSLIDGVPAAAWGETPADGWSTDPRLPELGWRRYDDFNAEGDDDYRAHRFGLGVLDPVVDTTEPLYPIEANLDLLNGVDFKKGCFIGQETTSRMKRRGQIKSRVAPILVDGPPLPPGAELLAGELRAGTVLVSQPGRALALVRIDRAIGQELTIADRSMRLDVPSWLNGAFSVDAERIEA
jgi:folate-binding protein YgfZ